MTTDLISAIADAVAAKPQPKSPRKLHDLKAASEYRPHHPTAFVQIQSNPMR